MALFTYDNEISLSVNNYMEDLPKKATFADILSEIFYLNLS